MICAFGWRKILFQTIFYFFRQMLLNIKKIVWGICLPFLINLLLHTLLIATLIAFGKLTFLVSRLMLSKEVFTIIIGCIFPEIKPKKQQSWYLMCMKYNGCFAVS